jgi:DNA-binding transcriptional regulator YiaG
MHHYTGCGLKNIWLKNGYTLKTTPYGKAVSIQNLEGLHKVIGLDLIMNKKHFSGLDIRFLRKELDLSQIDLAHFFGVGDTTVRNWESGRGKIAEPAERLLRVLYREQACGDGKIKELLDRLGQLNRDNHRAKMTFEETAKGIWRTAA